MSERFNQPEQGSENWGEPLNENFADLGIEVTEEVATWGDLPAQSEVSQSTNGHWPVYRVADDDVFVEVSDSATTIIGGTGSADHPLPDLHANSLSTEDAYPETVTDSIHYAGAYDGADNDARLDAALSAANTDDTIILENNAYSADRTISERLTIEGPNSLERVDSAWTIDSQVQLVGVGPTSNGEIIANSDFVSIQQTRCSSAGTVTVNGDFFRFVGNRGGNVTFASGTSGGVVDGCVGTTVTDNGSNTVGDTA